MEPNTTEPTANRSTTEWIADFHIHSHYSRATSKDLTFEHLARWAQLKGVHLVGTGDIAHPGWLAEMREKLVPAEEGLYRLKDEIAAEVEAMVPPSCRNPVRFMLAGEISNIYKRHDAVRKVHNVIFAPSLDEVAAIQNALEKIGNIRSDGRPILGLDSRDLLEIILDIHPRCHLIPAHIWTPWFSMLGSKSGFDTVEQCFGDLTPHIFALETGLSSDPPMNWRVSNLDRYTLVSTSDAHSPQKLAREATIFHSELAYDAIFAALQTGDETFGGTLEFFPEEGKYHLDGHRKCNVRWEPSETKAHNGRCVVCGKPVTVGVMHRVDELADRPPGGKPARTHPFTSLVPLPEVLGEVHSMGPNSKRVQQAYENLLAKVGPELYILRHAPLEDIAAAGGDRVAEAVRRLRRGAIVAEGGYDGEYGVVRVFGPGTAPEPQLGLFGEAAVETTIEAADTAGDAARNKANGAPPMQAVAQAEAVDDPPDAAATDATPPRTVEAESGPDWLARLNDEQRAAVTCVDAPLVIVAGPGTGKTRTLTVRIAHLIDAHGVAPEAILAITFTNQAAQEMAQRLAGLVRAETVKRLTIQTFHAFGAALLRQYADRIGLPADFAVADEADRLLIMRQALPDLSERAANALLAWISGAKNRLIGPDDPAALADAPIAPAEAKAEQVDPVAAYRAYQEVLTAAGMVDFDDLLRLPVQLLANAPTVAAEVHARYRYISVDEYQDVNHAQAELLRLLVAGGANVCVIGDPDQAIYGFRGADPAYFTRFQSDFPGAVTVQLRQSYRSPQSLLDAAMQVITHNTDRSANLEGEAQALWSEFSETVKLDIVPTPTDRAEAETIVHTIEQMVGGTSYFSLDSGRVEGTEQETRSFGDFAVLYRLNAQARLLVEAFDRSGIPYQVVGQTALREQRPVRGLLALLHLHQLAHSTTHSTPQRAAQRATPALTTLLGSGSDGLTPQQIGTLAAEIASVGITQALADAQVTLPLKAAQRRRVAGLADIFATWPDAPDIAGQIEPLLTAWLAWQGEPRSDEHTSLIAQLRRLAEAHGSEAQPTTDVQTFLTALALQSAADGYDSRADRVTLTTLHAAKGLEFPVVFIAGCEEGLLPYVPPNTAQDSDTADRNTPQQVAEERRLFYVGMTRARARLFLLHAKRRMLFGQTIEQPPSRFLDEIEAALKAVQARGPRPAKRPSADELQLKLF